MKKRSRPVSATQRLDQMLSKLRDHDFRITLQRLAVVKVLASTDLLSIDRAFIDMVYKLPEAELHDLRERIESRKGLRQLSYMKKMRMGSDQYKLIRL